MLIGIIGSPNKGKSRFFSSLTRLDVGVADYPFTTIDPNKGVALMPVTCACASLGIKCNARGGCDGKKRLVPVQLLDVAGLVPDAHEGKGMGNQFLDDLSNADGFAQIIDATGRTDLEGKPAQNFPISDEVGFLKGEMAHWLLKVLKKNSVKFKHKTEEELADALSGLNYSRQIISRAAKEIGMDTKRICAEDDELSRLANWLVNNAKPMIVAANKADVNGALARIKKAQEEGIDLVPCSAEYEYTLVLAMKKGIVNYSPGEPKIQVMQNADEKQKTALKHIEKFLIENKGTGVYEVLNRLIFDKMGMIIVYPVEDENHYCDGQGKILPDAILLPKGSTTIDLAKKVHTEFAKKFIGAIDARTKMRVGKEHVLKDQDIIKIIAGR